MDGLEIGDIAYSADSTQSAKAAKICWTYPRFFLTYVVEKARLQHGVHPNARADYRSAADPAEIR